VDLGNHANGVLVSGGSDNVIGGLTSSPGTGSGNVISGNDANGIFVYFDRIVPRFDGTVVQGNILGLNAGGTKPLGNASGGFRTADAGALIGGTDPMARNVISSNEYGVLLSNSGSDYGTLIQGNFIGTDITGRERRGNTAVGVAVGSAPGTHVGGEEFGAGNVISGNRTGVSIGGISHPTIDTGYGRFNCVVQGNVIGLDVTGTARVDNNDGVIVTNSDNLIGGRTPNPGHGAGNIISGNTVNGVSVVWNRTGLRVEGTVVKGNLIGLDGSGTIRLGNGLAGFRTTDAGALVGGAEAGARNIISGNQYGVLLSNSGSYYKTVIHGNFVGTDIAGRFAVPNTSFGIGVGSAPNTYVGGLMPGEGNLISGNGIGVSIGSISHRAIDGLYNCVVAGNFIGLDAAGTGAIPNTTGIHAANNDNLIRNNTVAFNRQNGIVLQNSSGNIVMDNTVHDNGRDGISLVNANGSAVMGNAVYMNRRDGISLENADNNWILMNKSHANTRDGIRLDAGSTGNKIMFNEARGNGEFDARDDSIGGFPPGVANIWWMNAGGTDSPDGLLG
jgi:parallel beta-helix repeat protein